MNKTTAIVGGASKALTIAARIASVMPEGAAAAMVGGLLGDSAGIAKAYMERKKKRQAERIEAIRHEVIDRRLAHIEEELEVSDEQVDLAIHVFRKVLEDDESQKERYYGALLELVLRNQIDVQALKVLVSAVESLAKVELDEFVHSSRPSRSKWHFSSGWLRDTRSPRKQETDYFAVLRNRLIATSLIRFDVGQREAPQHLKGGGAGLFHEVTLYGETLLAAVSSKTPNLDDPRSPVTTV